MLKTQQGSQEIYKIVLLLRVMLSITGMSVSTDNWVDGAILKLPAQHYTTRKSILHEMADLFP